jgi:hypothetical protein
MNAMVHGRGVWAFVLALTLCRPAEAGPEHYEFQLVPQEAKVGEAVVSVRLVDTRTGAAVPDAVVFAKRMDMAPDGMETMTSPIERAAAAQPGIYAFKTQFTMAGGWRLSLAAKVQGEEGTVTSRVVIQVAK